MEQKGSYFSVIVLPWSSCYNTLPTCPSFSTSMMSCAHGDLGMDVIPSSGVMHKESSCVHLCRWVQKSVLQPQPSTCYSSPDRQGPKGPLPERRLSGAMLLMVMFSQLQTAWWLTAVLSQDHAVNRQCSGLVLSALLWDGYSCMEFVSSIESFDAQGLWSFAFCPLCGFSDKRCFVPAKSRRNPHRIFRAFSI